MGVCHSVFKVFGAIEVGHRISIVLVIVHPMGMRSAALPPRCALDLLSYQLLSIILGSMSPFLTDLDCWWLRWVSLCKIFWGSFRRLLHLNSIAGGCFAASGFHGSHEHPAALSGLPSSRQPDFPSVPSLQYVIMPSRWLIFLEGIFATRREAHFSGLPAEN